MKKETERIRRHLRSVETKDLVGSMHQEWSKYLILTVWMQMLFSSCDYREEEKVMDKTLTSTALNLWFCDVFTDLKGKYIESFLRLVRMKRRGEDIGLGETLKMLTYGVEFVTQMGTCKSGQLIKCVATRRQMRRGDHVHCPGFGAPYGGS